VANTTTDGTGHYAVSVPAGTYCVGPNPDPAGGWNHKSGAVTVTVANGGSANADFRYWTIIYR
jgi:hypothetical protein